MASNEEWVWYWLKLPPQQEYHYFVIFSMDIDGRIFKI